MDDDLERADATTAAPPGKAAIGELAKPSLILSPPLVHRGFHLRLGTMLRLMQGGQSVLKGLDLKTRSLTKLNVPGLLQHLADPPLPRGTTLGGLAQPQGHLRPVLNGLSKHCFAQDLEAFKADMTSMLSDMLQSSLSKFASQLYPSSGGQGDSGPTQTVASVPTVDVASNCDDTPPGPEDQSEGEIIDSEGDPADAGIPILDNLKMSEEEQRDYDAFSLASVSVSKRPWRAQEDSKVSKPQPQNISFTRQARPVTSQAVAKAQSVKSAQSDQRSVQLRSVQEQPLSQAQFPDLLSQGQGQRQGLGRPVLVRRDDIDSLFNEEEFSIDLDNEAVLKEKQARSEALDRVAEFCNLDRQDPRFRKRLWA